MPALSFPQLAEIYRNTQFDAGSETGVLTIVSEQVAETLRELEADDDKATEAGIAVLDDNPQLVVDSQVRIRATAPRLGLGLFAATFDNLLEAPRARIREPERYYVVDGPIDPATGNPPPSLQAYRAVLKIVALFAEAASYLDETRSELIFIDDGKFTVPVQYNFAQMSRVIIAKVGELSAQFDDPTHKDQKLEILAQAVLSISRPIAPAARFQFLLTNLDAVSAAVRDGYRLFASNFSYSKIRSDLEAAKIEFVTKIHKTVVDIQAQLLGIPVATVIVASQLKVASTCSLELWTDVAIVAGAWIFLLLLLVAIINQWLTLGVIKQEIDRQKAKLISDYAVISGQFTDIFNALTWRICWHRIGLAIVLLIAVFGAIFATVAFNHLVSANVRDCLNGSNPLVVTKAP